MEELYRENIAWLIGVRIGRDVLNDHADQPLYQQKLFAVARSLDEAKDWDEIPLIRAGAMETLEREKMEFTS